MKDVLQIQNNIYLLFINVVEMQGCSESQTHDLLCKCVAFYADGAHQCIFQPITIILILKMIQEQTLISQYDQSK